MDQQQTQQTQQPPVVAFQNNIAPEHKKVGPIIAVLIIILVLIIGALYLFASRINEEQVPTDSSVAADGTPSALQQSQTSSSGSADQFVQPVTNNADDVTSLEADLNASTKGLDGQNF